jgi:EAL domain-containing protein (putative c-di-GMP-specific phosphodiesterase class I)
METIGDRLLCDINEIEVFESTTTAPVFSIGMTRYNADTNLKTIMAHIDYALLQAELKKENNYHLYQEKNELEDLMLLGRETWVKAISEAIDHHRLEWVSQACIDVSNSNVYHHEIYTKMKTKDGDVLSADFFLPIAKYAGLLDDIDSYLFKEMMQRDENNIALNISIDSIKNSMFITLVQEFAYRVSLKRKKPHIHFEINLNSIGNEVKVVADFSKMLRRLGYSFGIDHFMFWPNSIDLIGTIAPAYLKVSVEHLTNYAKEDSYHMMQSIHNITATYGVHIIAVNVENEEQKNILNKIDIRLIQGRYIEDIKSL